MPEQPTMTVDEFVAKWSAAEGGESSLSQSQFNDLCAVLGTQTPSEADEAGSGDDYAFEKRVPTGSADVWKRGCFGWEYKSPGSNLVPAYQQLLGYREGLENPPLLIVSDMKKFEIHTNFTNAPVRVIKFSLKDLRDNPGYYVRILRDAFHHPEALHPNRDPRYITQVAARQFGIVADALRAEGRDPALVARFLNRVLFCLFAESIGLFDHRDHRQRPMFDLFQGLQYMPDRAHLGLRQLFDAMARPSPQMFGTMPIRHFNGGLFDQSAPIETIRLTGDLVSILYETAELDWSRVDPSILGTLFERGLDVKRRAQSGAHFTDYDTIMRVVEPVLVHPLRDEFEQLKERCRRLPPVSSTGVEPAGPTLRIGERSGAEALIDQFHQRLAAVRVLDPACGSGNFLYVALRELKNLEQDLIDFAQAEFGMNNFVRQVGPANCLGIDNDPYAVDLTRVSLWIGDLQWSYEHGYPLRAEPILGRIDQIECRDALLELDPFGNPLPEPAEWPEAEFIIGNPPFLGSARMRRELGDEYVDAIHTAWREWVHGASDLSVYWHEAARQQIASGRASRAGLLTTQQIRGEYGRVVLQRILDTGSIFFAFSDEPWIGDGAAVRIAIVGQDSGAERTKTLDGASVRRINADLSSHADVSQAQPLPDNMNIAHMGMKPYGPFTLLPHETDEMLSAPLNVNGRPNSDVVRPFVTADDLVTGRRDRRIIDFGTERDEDIVCEYLLPYEHLRRLAKPARSSVRSLNARKYWWLFERSRPGLRASLQDLKRFIATPRVSRHRFFVWVKSDTILDSGAVAIASDDDYVFGVLSSRVHTVWSLATGTRLGAGNDPRYVHTQTFDTFPFPWELETKYNDLSTAQQGQQDRIIHIAKQLDDWRSHWLRRDQKRTITELYNEMPRAFRNRQRALNLQVLIAYGWPPNVRDDDVSDDEILERLLALNLDRASERD